MRRSTLVVFYRVNFIDYFNIYLGLPKQTIFRKGPTLKLEIIFQDDCIDYRIHQIPPRTVYVILKSCKYNLYGVKERNDIGREGVGQTTSQVNSFSEHVRWET